ncbi:hypothetical protein JAN5088_00556 [Jannaschia rubra]|uniref:Uncharacterized protein n=1 Tax=Jannaschia rubra TaxID=282197 RepID=A0A0M6XMK2_9RHOB|nr:hypothetical protein JAN5088_00556 [Jannaschia rubra]SFG53658.1 hypothetical protein SAMN04488517_10668 [Jannaschia rubra]
MRSDVLRRVTAQRCAGFRQRMPDRLDGADGLRFLASVTGSAGSGRPADSPM